MPKLLSLADLQKLVEERQDQIEALLRKREQLEKAVQDIDDEIRDFLNPAGPRRSRRSGRPRPQNEAPLRTVVHQVLEKNKKGLSLADLTSKVAATGYKSYSKNLKNVVYQCLYNAKDISLDKQTGLYSLTK